VLLPGRVPLRRASHTIEEKRSNQRFVASALGIKSWMARMPTCAAARPATCPCCEAAARPVGGRLVIVGHGVVERQVQGPMEAAGTPESLVVQVRRYRCRACRAILEVGPRGLVRGRWYSAGAMAVALAAYARGETTCSARRRVSPHTTIGTSASERWVTVVRWVDATSEGHLFGVPGLGGLPRRQVAEHVVVALAGRGGRALGEDLAEAAFTGAAIAA
jgi:hypothetical protein